jgi:hypothetical protein
MLLEVSGKGARVELDEIPCPDLAKHGISLEQWVRMYPGMGFVLTLKEHNLTEVQSLFHAAGMTAKVIGVVDSSRDLRITSCNEESSVFDFSGNDGITHLGAELGCIKAP